MWAKAPQFYIWKNYRLFSFSIDFCLLSLSFNISHIFLMLWSRSWLFIKFISHCCLSKLLLVMIFRASSKITSRTTWASMSVTTLKYRPLNWTKTKEGYMVKNNTMIYEYIFGSIYMCPIIVYSITETVFDITFVR